MHRICLTLGVLLVALPAAADTINIDVRNNFFVVTSSVPGQGTNTATINTGDTVVWTWFGFLHSVTETGGLFDSGVHNLPFTFEFTFNDPGTFNYVCVMHADHMTGAIIVEDPGCAEDLNADGQVDLSDLATLLSNFGRTDDPGPADGDIDGDGAVNLTDLAMLLSAFGMAC